MWNKISGYSSRSSDSKSRSSSSKSSTSDSKSSTSRPRISTYTPPLQEGRAPQVSSYVFTTSEMDQLRDQVGLVPGRPSSPEMRQRFFNLVEDYSHSQVAKGYRSIIDEQSDRSRQPTAEIDTQGGVDKGYHQAASSPSQTQWLLGDYDKV